MKNILLVFVLCLLCMLCLTACNNDEPPVTGDNSASDNQNNTDNGEEHIHTPNVAVVENKIPATCTTDGSYDLVIYCTGCGVKMIWVTNTESAIGHNYINLECSTCGSAAEPSQGLRYKSNYDGTCYVSGIGTCTDKIIVIPSISPIGDIVTGIDSLAFFGCTNFMSIKIPDSVTSIGSLTFNGCTSLVSINVDANNTTYKSIDGNLYTKDEKTLVQYAIGKTDTHFTIPDSVTSINQSAFSDCEILTSVTIPDSVTSIGSQAFSGCTNLTSVIIHDSVTSIDSWAFAYCTSLTSITIPDSVTNIDADAFANCDALTSVTIGKGVTSIGLWVFSNCTSLMTINVDANNPTYKSIDGNLYTKDEKTLVQYAIGKTDTHFTIPDSITSINHSAFSDCESLTSVTIPDSVTSIGSQAFSGCTNLTSVIIPDGVTSINQSAFSWCPSLKSITIPDSVTSIWLFAFEYCNNLTDVYYTGSEEDWSAITIEYANDPLSKATIHYNYAN